MPRPPDDGLRRREVHAGDPSPDRRDARGDYPGHEWALERTGGRGLGDARAWERSPRWPEPPRYGWGSAWQAARADDECGPRHDRGDDGCDYDQPWHSERHGEHGEPLRPDRDSYDDRHDQHRMAVPRPDRPRTSAERWGLGRSGARDAWGADLRGAVEARAGRFAGRGPRGYRRSDERILKDLCDLLLDAGHVDASQLEVAVQDGEVTIEGRVPDRRMKRDAEDLAETVAGVEQVHNRLRIDTTALTDTDDASGRQLR